ncbi:hypothetical protein CC86DRAFT_388023 [Ophiobolus disseminans]|uniref:Rhodopsin domain-containing protein n=1 Tax=Ophiobolus disseminans TaxID=1469910 RepID=A0A6A6ZHD1_9PLEO|nr:hypothetical protein CC86DRAFT_388023 [Ophiobolus disseminans]
MWRISTITIDAYYGIGIFLTILTAMSIGMRLTMSMRQFKTLLMEDYTSIIGFVLVVASYVFNQDQYKSKLPSPYFLVSAYHRSCDVGLSKGLDLAYIVNISIAAPIMAAFSTWFSKTPVLLLYQRLFNVYTWVRYSCLFVLVALAIGLFGSLIAPLVHCHPREIPHTAQGVTRCSNAARDMAVISGTVSVAADLAIMLLPLRPIINLRLSTRKKVGVCIVFSSGLFGVVASLVSLVYRVHLHSSGDISGILTGMLLTFVESSIALMIGCAPGVRGFWNAYVLPSKIFISIRSSMSRLLSSRTSQTSSYSAQSERKDDDQGLDVNRLNHEKSVNK